MKKIKKMKTVELLVNLFLLALFIIAAIGLILNLIQSNNIKNCKEAFIKEVPINEEGYIFYKNKSFDCFSVYKEAYEKKSFSERYN